MLLHASRSASRSTSRPPSQIPAAPSGHDVPSPGSSDAPRTVGPARPVVLADDDVFLEHVAPPDHPERGERLLAVRRGLRGASGLSCSAYLPVVAADASREQLARVHRETYLDELGQLAGRSGYLDADTFLAPGSVAAARRAAGSAVQLVEALASGAARFGIAVPRPPGHHALPDRAMGFCLLNNVAVAAAHARSLGHERVLVLDWDVHHGNGTQEMFDGDPAVLFISLHQFPNYPGTGAADEQGKGEGIGCTVNIPLPQGGTDEVYAAALGRIALPIIEQFRPTFALVSCGFDAHAHDPLAQMRLTAEGFGDLTRSVVATLDAECPLGLVLEGGYDLEALEASTQAVAGALMDPAAPTCVGRAAPRGLFPLEEEALMRAAAHQRSHWKLG